MPLLTVELVQDLINQYKPKIQTKFNIVLEEIVVASLMDYNINRQRLENEGYPLFIELAIPLHNYLFKKQTKMLATSRKIIYVNEENHRFVSQEQLHFMMMWAMMNRLRDRLNFRLQEDLPKDFKSFMQKFSFPLECIIKGFPIYMAADQASDIYKFRRKMSAINFGVYKLQQYSSRRDIVSKPAMLDFLENKRAMYLADRNQDNYAQGYRFFHAVHEQTQSIDSIFHIVRHPDVTSKEIRNPKLYLARI